MNSLKTYLTEAYAIDNQSILRILTQNKQINKADPDYSYYEKLANWANSGGKQQKLKNIDLNTINLTDRGLLEKRKLTARYTTLGHLLLALKNLMDQEGKYTPSSEISRLVQQTTLEILAALSGISKKSSEDTEEEPEEEIPDNPVETDDSGLYAGMDWTAEKARRLENTQEDTSVILDKFYDDYYNVEYAGRTKSSNGDQNIVAKLKSLSKILIPEFNALGYNPDVNPFAQFLKILIEKKRSIFDKLNTNTYGAIHNSFIRQHITGNMLGNYNEGNILFCNDLYSNNGLVIIEYLSLQKQVQSKQPNSKHTNVEHLISKIFVRQNIKGATYRERVDNLLRATPKLVGNDDNTKLRSILEIRELFNYLFGAMPKVDVNIQTGDEILEKAKKADVVLEMLQYFLEQEDFKKPENNTADLAEKIHNLLDKVSYKPNDSKRSDVEQILSGYNINTSAERIIVTKLMADYLTSEEDADN